MPQAKGHPDWLSGLNKSVVYSPGRDQQERQRLINTISTQEMNALQGPPPTLAEQAYKEAKAFMLDTKLNLLLVALPLAIISKAVRWGDGPTFVFSMIALCPLAERLGFVTEQLAMYTNDTLGGLLNATFGNATEVIISGFALSKGYLRIVQLSLLGSVVSNLLLVLGSAFIAGGIKNTTQTFNQQGINVNCGLLLVGTLAISLPSLLSETDTQVSDGNASELLLSRLESIFLLLCYGCYLAFQLYTHRYLYEGGEDTASKSSDPGGVQAQRPGELPSGMASDKSAVAILVTGSNSANGSGREMELTARRGPDGRSLSGRAHPAGSAADLAETGLASGPNSGRRSPACLPATTAGLRGRDDPDDLDGVALDSAEAGRQRRAEPEPGQGSRASDDDEEEEEAVLSKVGCFLWLTLVTLLIAMLSEWIMTAIKGASKTLHIPMPFLVTILLPIVGNAAEHASAVVFAYKNRIEIALGVAVGSSTQIAVLVVPFCVVLAWMIGQPLDLNFNAFEASVYFLAVLLAAITVMDGNANWLKGVVLLVAYVLIAIGFFTHNDVDLAQEDVDAA